MTYLKLKEISGELPTSEYELFDGELLVGRIQIRHKSSRAVGLPENMASNIYYEILPEHRSKGYGKKILALGLEKAREIGLTEVIVTCMEDNEGSRKIIETNGGVFTEDTIIPNENKRMLKYRISLT